MTSVSSSMSLPPLLLHQQNHSKGPSDLSPHREQQNDHHSSLNIPSGINDIPKKPMRPLTAYHIFFQIEREFVIQTTAGEDADKSIHDNKVYLEDVPLRYKNVKLLRDWFAGPGKRKKRKHRKQHGKIGFLELSRVISTRWARLKELDPETKNFVQKIAQQELDEYYREMKEYKELTKDLVPASEKTLPRPSVPEKKAKKCSSSNMSSLPTQQEQRYTAPCPDMVSSSYRAINSMHPTSIQFQNDIDYFLSRIDDKTRNLISPSFGVENRVQTKREMCQRQESTLPSPHFEPLVEVSCHANKPIKKQRRINTASCMSPTSVASPASVEVDICDDEILQLWKSHNY